TTVPGRTLLLLTSEVEAAIGQRAIEDALAVGPERALAELFRRTRGVRDMTAVLVADLDLDERALLAPPPLDPMLGIDESIAGREAAMPETDSGSRQRAPMVTTTGMARTAGDRTRGFLEAVLPGSPTPARGRWGRTRREPGQPLPLPSIRRPSRVVGRR